MSEKSTADDSIKFGPHRIESTALPANPRPSPNNCATCEHKQYREGGWCYMFMEEPISVCGQHTELKSIFKVPILSLIKEQS